MQFIFLYKVVKLVIRVSKIDKPVAIIALITSGLFTTKAFIISTNLLLRKNVKFTLDITCVSHVMSLGVEQSRPWLSKLMAFQPTKPHWLLRYLMFFILLNNSIILILKVFLLSCAPSWIISFNNKFPSVLDDYAAFPT